MSERKCDKCTVCCQGWLSANIHGHSMYPGKPCHFLGDRCTIYPKRPHEPCVTYKCGWLGSDEFPEWMRPDRCKVVMTWREEDGVKWLEAQEIDNVQMDSKILTWLMINQVGKRVNLRWMVCGAWNYFGDTKFGEVMKRKYP